MASPEGLAEQRRDMIPRRVRGAVWRGFVFDSGACMCHNIKCHGRGSRYGGGEPVRASSEAETRSRGRLALERGGTSPEGASSPRARRSLTRGGVQPSSEAEPYSRGRPALKQGRASSEGASSPLARRSFFSAVLCPSSEVEFLSRVAGADCSGGPLRPPGPWALATDRRLS
jgi:hypothetical protein